MKDNLDKISGFSIFLSGRDHSLKEILYHLNRTIFIDLAPISIRLGQVNENNMFVIVSGVGISAEDSSRSQLTVAMEDKYPGTDAVRHGKVVLINTLPNFGSDYPLAKNLQVSTYAKTVITFPVYVAGTPVSAFILLSRIVLSLNDELESFLKAIASVFSLYFYRNVLSSPDKIDEQYSKSISKQKDSHENSLELSERQFVILRLISEERTNQSISQFLGYSESTIRQEIIRIFAKLNCSTRIEAAEINRGFGKDQDVTL